MKKWLQFVLLGCTFTLGSTDVLLASNTGCRTWANQVVEHAAQTVAVKRHRISKKVLAAWAAWRAKHPHAKLAPKPEVPFEFACDSVPEINADITKFPLQDPAPPPSLFPLPAITEDSPTPVPMELAEDVPPSPAAPPPSGSPEVISPGPGATPAPPSTGPSGSPPPPDTPILPPSGPPDTDPPLPPPPPPPPIIAVTPEPGSFFLLGTSALAMVGLIRRRKARTNTR